MVRPDKFMFNINMLSLAFDINKSTVRNMLTHISTVERKGNSKFYDIKDVATLTESRDLYAVERSTNNKYKSHHTNSTAVINPDDEIVNDPEQMNSIEKINYYKAEDLRQSAQLKQHKNDVESGKLMVATNVERTTAEAFKKIALVLDTLPDLLERDGIIGSGDIEKVIRVLDNSRQQLTVDLTDIAPAVKEINYNGDW